MIPAKFEVATIVNNNKNNNSETVRAFKLEFNKRRAKRSASAG